MADGVKKPDKGEQQGLSTIGRIETALENLGVGRFSLERVSPEVEERARAANPEIEALADKSRYDAMHGHFWKGEKEHLEVVGKSIMDTYHRIVGGHDVKEHAGAPVTPVRSTTTDGKTLK